jgi:hypothetical protein
VTIHSSARQVYLNKRTRRADGRHFRVGPIPDILMRPPGDPTAARGTQVRLFAHLTLPVAHQFDFPRSPEIDSRSQGSNAFAAEQVKRQVTPEGT